MAPEVAAPRTRPAGGRRCILLYHRVVPDDTPQFMLDALSGELVTAGIFSRQLAWLKRRYEIVSLDTLLARPGDRAPLATITFDDGLADNLANALPILRHHSLSATIFVIFGMIGRRAGFLHHGLARWAASSARAGDEALGPARGRPRARLRAAASRFAAMAEDDYPADLREFLRRNDQDRFLDERELASLVQAGVSIQSHTVNHERVSQLADDALARELADSKRGLEALLQLEVNHLAYPVGRADDVDARSPAAARAAGYVSACTAIPGFLDQAPDPFLLPRIGARNSMRRLRSKLQPSPFSRLRL